MPIRGPVHAFADHAGAVVNVFRNRELRCLELAWGGFIWAIERPARENVQPHIVDWLANAASA